MFLCDDCTDARSMVRSHMRCDQCGTPAACNDVPASERKAREMPGWAGVEVDLSAPVQSSDVVVRQLRRWADALHVDPLVRQPDLTTVASAAEAKQDPHYRVIRAAADRAIAQHGHRLAPFDVAEIACDVADARIAEAMRSPLAVCNALLTMDQDGRDEVRVFLDMLAARGL